MTSDPIIWTGALLTVFAFSYLFKENAFYKATEHLYVGVASGYVVVMGYRNFLDKVVTPVGKGQLLPIIPTILGLMLFSIFFGNEYRWMRRWPIAVTVGIGTAVTARTSVVADLINQTRATMIPLVAKDFASTANNIVIVLGVVSVLCYFFFTFKQTPVLKAGSELGKWVLMITFGAAFGNGIMGRISLLIGRLFLLFQDWIPLIKKA